MDRASWPLEMLQRAAELAPQQAAVALVGAMVVGALALGQGRWGARALRIPAALGVAGALGLGLWQAWARRSFFDDAFISMRYAHNLVEGRGLVWNPGEAVEGYTNFLWTLLMALSMLVAPESPELSVTLLCLLSYLGTAALLWGTGRLLQPEGLGGTVAAGAYLVNGIATEFATTGMETSAAALTVLALVGCLLKARGPRDLWVVGASLSGLLAALLHPDLLLFWGVGGLVVLGWSWQAERGLAARLTPALRYGGVAVLLLPYLAWKLHFYGALLPNTYWAKSGDLSYFSQGGIYLLSVVLGEHAWILVLLVVAGLVGQLRAGLDLRDLRARFWAFVAIGAPLYLLYVAKVGGDFMYGRFVLPLLPLLLLGAALVPFQAHRLAVPAGVLFGLGLWSLPIVGPDFGRWYMANEEEVYPVDSYRPFSMNHANFVAGHRFKELLGDSEVLLASSGIGMLGYYSELPVLDMRGLTDKEIARLPLKERAMPGHEKWPEGDLLTERRVRITRWRSANPGRWRKQTAVWLERPGPKHWHFWLYDPHVVEVLSVDPDVELTRFPEEFDRWVRTARGLSDKEFEQDVAFIQRYYFTLNEDPERAAVLAGLQAERSSVHPE